MGEHSMTSGAMTIGIDLGDRFSQICVLDDEGDIVEEARVRTTPAGFRTRFASCESVRVVLEAGTHSPWASRVLAEAGHEVIVANPRKLRLIYQNDSKDDRVDAEYLARVGRMDPALLAPVSHRSEECQADRAMLSSRDILVRTRVKLIAHIRGAVKSMGRRLPTCSSGSFARRAEAEIPEALKPALDPILESIRTLDKQIRRFDEKVKRLASDRYPETGPLQAVHGVGPLTALSYVLTLETPDRFVRSRDVGAYLGLRPRRADSGKLQPQLRITKAGDAFLRKLLVGSAHYILGPFGPDSDLRRWGMKLAERGGKSAKKRAVVAVARKLAVLLHRLWSSDEPYDPLRNAVVREEPVGIPAGESHPRKRRARIAQ